MTHSDAIQWHDSAQRILESAGRCFGQNGYDGSSMNTIDREASLSKALLHDHFESKEQLYTKVVLATCEGLLSRLEEITDLDHGSREKLEYVLDEVLSFVERELDQVSLMLEFRGVVNMNPSLAQELSNFHEEVVKIIVQGFERVLGDLTQLLFIPADRVARLLLVQLNGTVAGFVFATCEDETARVREAYRDMGRLLSRSILRGN